MQKWLQDLYDIGLVPYVTTAGHLLSSLDLSLFEGRAIVKLLEDPAERNFHEAYLVSNSLGFGNPELKMPNWVYIDCVLMQSATVGFAIATDKAPASLVEFYKRDPYVDVSKLDYIPVSGQIAGLGIDGKTLVGFSLFSLRKQLGLNVPRLAHLTKYAALRVYRAQEKERFLGISHYDNRALVTHAVFGKKMYIESATMPLHPLREMCFTYSMKVEFDEDRILNGASPAIKPDFLLRADDTAKKMEMYEKMKSGTRYHIVAPVHVRKDDGLYLPICVEEPK